MTRLVGNGYIPIHFGNLTTKFLGKMINAWN